MVPRLLAGGIVLVVLMNLLFRARRFLFASWFLVAVWRWHSGEASHGRPVTDAGWFRSGTRALTPTGHAHHWWHRPRWQRAAHRTGATLVLAALIAGALVAPVATLAVLAACAVVVAGWQAWRLAAWLRSRKHRSTYLVPLHLAAHELVGLPRAKRAASWITYDLEAKRVTLALPQGWPADEGDKARLVRIATQKLGIENPRESWRFGGPRPTLTIEQAAPVPDMVRLDDVRDALAAAGRGEIVLGLGQASKPVTWKQALPHAGISAETGAGKSGSARGIIAQHLHAGGIVAILDAPKRFSHQWCKGLPNVAYARTAEESAQLLHWLREESDHRNEVADVAADLEGNVSVPFIPVMFVVEEANALMSRIRDWWRRIEGDGRAASLSDLDELIFVGRQIRYRGLFIGQRLSAKATSNADLRENIGLLMLMNPSKAAWDMLAKRFPQPPPDNTKGRAQVVTDKVQECQMLWMTGAEAREYAMAGTVTVCPDDMPCRIVSSPRPALPGGPDQPFVPETRPFVPAPPDQVTLSEAVRLGIAPVNLAVARKRPQRDERHPRPVGKRGQADVYDSLALADYYEEAP